LSFEPVARKGQMKVSEMAVICFLLKKKDLSVCVRHWFADLLVYCFEIGVSVVFLGVTCKIVELQALFI
jgi:hypothetical protein